MKAITYEEFLKFKPCWLEDGRAEELAKIGARKEQWTALDILKLRGVDADDKLWAVFKAGLIPVPIVHEFACRCAVRALEAAGIKDDGNNASWNGIHTRRRWLKGEATDEEMRKARDAADAARDAADAAWYAAWDAERKWQVKELIRMLKEVGWNE